MLGVAKHVITPWGDNGGYRTGLLLSGRYGSKRGLVSVAMVDMCGGCSVPLSAAIGARSAIEACLDFAEKTWRLS